MPLIGTSGNTAAPAYAVNVAGGQDFVIKALLTVGDEVALINTVTGGTVTTDAAKKFAFTGIPDGMGVYQPVAGGNYFVFVTHELGATAETDISSTAIGEKIIGARTSLFVFDADWKAVGGKNLIERVIDNGITYTLDTTTGRYAAPATTGSSSMFTGSLGGGGNTAASTLPAFGRFCSAYLASSGFVDAAGAVMPVFFTGEEVGSDSRGWAIAQDGLAVPLDGLGRFSKETVVADKNNLIAGKTVLLSTEDTADGEIYMWVGTPDATATTFAGKNGFATGYTAGGSSTGGDLFVLRLTGLDYEGQMTAAGATIGATWTSVADSAVYDSATGLAKTSGADLSTWVNASGRSTNFQRLEDLAQDTITPGKFYFATTGTANVPGSTSVASSTPAGAENPYGRLYSFTLGGTAVAPTVTNFKLELIGGPGKGVSYDNITVTAAGTVLLQEDETAFGGAVMASENREASVWEYNPTTAAVNGIAAGGVERILAVNENAAGLSFNASQAAKGQWETSGIVEAVANTYLFDVQAHGVVNASGSTSVLGGKHIEGGQLLIATKSLVATPAAIAPKPDFNSPNTNGTGVIANNPGVAGSYTGDGNADILWRNSATGQNAIWYVKANKFVHNNAAPVEGVDFDYIRTQASQDWQMIGSGDFNKDGKSDVLFRNKATGETDVWLMNGKKFASGTSSTATTYAAGDFANVANLADTNWQIQAIGDFNGDTNSDLVWRNKVTGENAIWYLDGTTNATTNTLNFKSGQSTANTLIGTTDYNYLSTIADLNWDIEAAADFNGDKKTDLVWRNKATGQNAIWFLNGAADGAGTVATASTDRATGFLTAGTNIATAAAGADFANLYTVADANWKMKSAADYDNDGNTDLFWQNESNGSTAMWFMSQVKGNDFGGSTIVRTGDLLNVGPSSATSGWRAAGLTA